MLAILRVDYRINFDGILAWITNKEILLVLVLFIGVISSALAIMISWTVFVPSMFWRYGPSETGSSSDSSLRRRGSFNKKKSLPS